MVESAITLAQKIWSFHISFIHGSSRVEAKSKLRERVISKAQLLYALTPKLHSRFSPISLVPLSVRVKRSTTNLQRWLSRVEHQIKVTKISADNQLSLAQAYKRLHIDTSDVRKYPP